MEHVLVTGANRGIGFGIVRYLLDMDNIYIFAGVRNPAGAEDLNKLAITHSERITIIPLEVTDESSIRESLDLVRQHTNKVDILVNNAGIDPDGQGVEQLTTDLFLRVLHVNTVAPFMIAQTYLGLLKAGTNPRIINISSEMGSLADRTYGGSHAYCASKAALNMVTRGLAVDLWKHGIITISLDPGWVRTDMGGSSASLSIDESALSVIAIISGLTSTDNGRYLAYDGSEHRW